MEQSYKARLEAAGASDVHQEKVDLVKTQSARRAERDNTWSHLQLVERVKEYERAIVSMQEAHVAEVGDRDAEHTRLMAEASQRHAAELRRVAESHERRVATLEATHAADVERMRDQVNAAADAEQRVDAMERAVTDAKARADAALEEARLAGLDAEAARTEAEENERQILADMAEREAQLLSNHRMVRGAHRRRAARDARFTRRSPRPSPGRRWRRSSTSSRPTRKSGCDSSPAWSNSRRGCVR